MSLAGHHSPQIFWEPSEEREPRQNKHHIQLEDATEAPFTNVMTLPELLTGVKVSLHTHTHRTSSKPDGS